MEEARAHPVPPQPSRAPILVALLLLLLALTAAVATTSPLHHAGRDGPKEASRSALAASKTTTPQDVGPIAAGGAVAGLVCLLLGSAVLTGRKARRGGGSRPDLHLYEFPDSPEKGELGERGREKGAALEGVHRTRILRGPPDGPEAA